MLLEPEETNDRKQRLLKHIESIPGIRYRELLRITGLPNGVLVYHLTSLEESGLIQVQRKKQSKTTRYFPANISEGESVVISCIRHEPLRRILMLLLEHDFCSADDIIRFTKKSQSTISAHLKHLRDEGLISVRRKELYSVYSLADRELVAEVTSKYRNSFVNTTVDNFLGMVEEL